MGIDCLHGVGCPPQDVQRMPDSFNVRAAAGMACDLEVVSRDLLRTQHEITGGHTIPSPTNLFGRNESLATWREFSDKTGFTKLNLAFNGRVRRLEIRVLCRFWDLVGRTRTSLSEFIFFQIDFLVLP